MRPSAPRPAAPAMPVPAGPPVRHALLGTWAGRTLLVGLALRLVVAGVKAVGAGESSVFNLLDRIGAIAVIAGGAYFLYRLFVVARQRLLWRVRRKLILSYVFIGVVPALLIVAFFVLCGLLLFFHVSSYLVQSRLRSLTEQAQFQAKTAATEIQRAGFAAAESILARRQANLELQYEGASFALVPTSARGCAGSKGSPPLIDRSARPAPFHIGPWAHLDPPSVLPEWVSCSGFGGLIAYVPAGSTEPVAKPREPSRSAGERNPNPNLEPLATQLAIRAAGLPEGPSPAFAVVLDLPINEPIAARLREETGIHLGRASVLVKPDDEVRPAAGRPGPPQAAPAPAAAGAIDRASRSWVTLVDYTDWQTGRIAPVTWAIDLNVSEVYDRLSSTQARIRGNRSFGQILLVFLAIIAALFLVIEFVALVMGLALAKSITGSVHALFTGTERLRQGDFTHRIKVEAHDQLGELAEQFNSMTGRLDELMAEAAEKKRLEEELRIARDIQMSLLPQGRLSVPGLSVTALCEPAREVGGDYYDFFPLDDDRLAVLIADVSGKGTSAAFYMAELKGLMLSLTQIYASPRELLINANRIIANHLPSRSFITMIYAVLDLRAGTMTYARAGHTPLIHLPADGNPRARVLAPDGMVLGLKLDGGEMFEQMLEEAVVPLQIGDLFLFFTDGISEAMNEDADCFDESRLCRLVEEHGHLSTDELRERILREVHGFVGGAPKHDDLTMILLRVEKLAAAREPVWVGAEGGRA